MFCSDAQSQTAARVLHDYVHIVCQSATDILQQAAGLISSNYQLFEAVSKLVATEMTGACWHTSRSSKECRIDTLDELLWFCFSDSYSQFVNYISLWTVVQFSYLHCRMTTIALMLQTTQVSEDHPCDSLPDSFSVV